MIIIKRKQEDNIEKSLKQLKRKVEKIGVLREVRDRKNFKKRSTKKRDERQKSLYLQRKRTAELNDN
jgi:small subunit ribosomal protein S21